MTRTIHISFKTLPQLWKKEKEGLKRNTVRKFYAGDEADVREFVLKDFAEGRLENNDLKITLVNTETTETFTRTVKDVTYWEGVYIISW